MARHNGFYGVGTKLILFIITAALLPAAAGAEVPFERVEAQGTPQWFSSVAWNSDETALVFLDTWEGSLSVHYLPPRSVDDKPFTVSTVDGVESFSPTLVKNSAHGLLVENDDGDLLWLDGDFKLSRRLNLLNVTSVNTGYSILSIWDFSEVGDRAILALADLRKGEDIVTGFIKVPLANPAEFETLDWLSHDDPSRKAYLVFGHQYFCSNRHSGYFMAMRGWVDVFEEPVEVSFGKAGGRSFKLTGMQSEFEQAPDIPWTSLSFAEKYHLLETSSMLTGLYCGDHGVFTLARRVESPDRLGWRITSLSQNLAELTEQDLPSEAKHVVAIPGSSRWAFLEIGSIEVPGSLDLQSVLLAPAEAIEGTSGNTNAALYLASR